MTYEKAYVTRHWIILLATVFFEHSPERAFEVQKVVISSRKFRIFRFVFRFSWCDDVMRTRGCRE